MCLINGMSIKYCYKDKQIVRFAGEGQSKADAVVTEHKLSESCLIRIAWLMQDGSSSKHFVVREMQTVSI